MKVRPLYIGRFSTLEEQAILSYRFSEIVRWNCLRGNQTNLARYRWNKSSVDVKAVQASPHFPNCDFN